MKLSLRLCEIILPREYYAHIGIPCVSYHIQRVDIERIIVLGYEDFNMWSLLNSWTRFVLTQDTQIDTCSNEL